jgi:integrase/recombinase XerD
MPIELLDSNGRRKYLTPEEREKFEEAAKQTEREIRTFCLVLKNTGCRISEALNLKVSNIDFEAKAIVFETLKQRRKGVFRQVPLSDSFLDELNLVHNLKSHQQKNSKEKIWIMSRATASRRIDEVMKAAKIQGVHACPKGLRHGFAIACMGEQIPLNIISKWLGHSSIITTAIYANATGQEERNIASRLWKFKSL